MALTIVNAPGSEPLTLTETKSHLRVTTTDEDALITALITAARESAENYTNRAFITQTFDLTLDSFPPSIVVPKAPLQSVTSVTYLDTDGVSQTLSTTEYTVDTKSEPGRIVESYTGEWPDTREEINAVTVRFVAGYGLAAAVPQAIKQGMLLHIGHMYANRENVLVGVPAQVLPMSCEYLYQPYRVYQF